MSDPNYIKAEAKSFGLLQRFGIDAPNFDVADIAYALGLEIRYGGLSSGDAWLVRSGDDKGIIRLNHSIVEPARQRFSIAHEIGHWEMHPNISQGYLCTARDLRDYGRSPEEAEANWFAATLMMPTFLIPQDVFKKDPSFAFVTQLAKDFGTSLTAAARRFVELSKQPVVLVSSTKGRVNWTARSKRAAYYFMKWGSQVPAHSLTAEVIEEKATDCRSDKIAPTTWFPEFNFDDEAELFEEVKYSDAYDTALTLLWIPN